MKINKSAIKTLAILALMLTVAGGATYTGKSIKEKKQNLSKLEQVKIKLVDSKKITDYFSSLPKDQESYPISSVFPLTMLTVYNNQIDTGVNISFVGPGTTGKTISSSMSFQELMETIDGTDVKTIKININGTYDNYEGLLNYLSLITNSSASISSIVIKEKTFNLSLQIYGTEG